MRVELFYDIVSPYSYLAFSCLLRYRGAWDLDLVLRPAFLGGVMKATGNTPTIMNAARAPYFARDIARMARWFNVPLQAPRELPANTLAAMRLLTAIAQEHPEMLLDASRLLWERHWTRDDDVKTDEGLTLACIETGFSDDDARGLVARITAPAIKELLKANTDEAVARGAFGFPAFFAPSPESAPSSGGASSPAAEPDELYFGCDRIELMAYRHKLSWRGPTP